MPFNDGGPAFPGPCQRETNVDINEGMFLLAFYAAAALQGWASGRQRDMSDGVPVKIAKQCGDYADALIAEEERLRGDRPSP